MDAPVTTASDPTPTQSNRSETSGIHFYLVLLAVLTALYALSPGPVAKSLRLGKAPIPKAFRTAYAPLNFCCNHLPPVQNFYDWYMTNLWQLP